MERKPPSDTIMDGADGKEKFSGLISIRCQIRKAL